MNVVNKLLETALFASMCTVFGISYAADFYVKPQTLWVPGGADSGQAACKALLSLPILNYWQYYRDMVYYVENYPYKLETPWNPPSGSCWFNPNSGGWGVQLGSLCPSGWSYISSYAMGGQFASDPYKVKNDSNPGYMYASPDLRCKRPLIDLAKNVGASQGCTSPQTRQSISIGTGNKFLREADLAVPVGPIYERYFNHLGNSIAAQSQVLSNEGIANLGARWTGSYSRTVIVNDNMYFPVGTDMSTAKVRSDDASTAYFTQNPGSSVWQAEDDNKNLLIENKDINGVRTGWSHSTVESDEVEIYDVKGRLLSVSNRNGYIKSVLYSDGTDGVSSGNGGFALDRNGNPTTTVLKSGIPLTVVDSNGRSIKFGYDASVRLVQLTDSVGYVYLYGYDDNNNNLTSVTYPDGYVKQYI
jgi:hypothetical protein